MIDFIRPRPAMREEYNRLLMAEPERGCEYSFANISLWGQQNIAFLHGCCAFFSHWDGRSVYPFPIGGGDKSAVIRAILDDARQRGIPCRITGITPADREFLEASFPGVFHLKSVRDSFDYVYAIDDLAELKGRKYQKKRNHANRFRAEHPDYRVEGLTCRNAGLAQHMVNDWFLNRRRDDPQGDYLLESMAMAKAFRHYDELGLEGLVLKDGHEILAVTMASRLSADTFDVHFEKAREDVDGAYTAVNREFALHLRAKYPDVKFLNREDDLGLEGLRKAKLSYLPHHMVEKYWAYVREDLDAD